MLFLGLGTCCGAFFGNGIASAKEVYSCARESIFQ